MRIPTIKYDMLAFQILPAVETHVLVPVVLGHVDGEWNIGQPNIAPGDVRCEALPACPALEASAI